MSIGTPARPLRVAVIGSGPAGFYTVEHLLRHADISSAVDIFDRLLTPYGLVRFGVAPDHEKIKSVTKAYERIASQPGVRFFGGVEIGRDLTDGDLAAHYDAIVLAVGAPVDRRMGIPGEDLPGSMSATDFVAWYNGHPDFRNLAVDLSREDVVVVGNGNVAVDVARILATDVDELARTDIADHALSLLRTSAVKRVTMLGRRGPAQAAFTPKEIRELGELAGATVVVDPADLAGLDGGGDADAERVLGALREVMGRTPAPGERTITLRFLTSPIALRGDTYVEAVEVAANELVEEGGTVRARPTDETAELAAGLVLRAVGYRGAPTPGYPFDERTGTIPNARGRIVAGDGAGGRYVAGWAKRGPQGVIGTNKADAGETVAELLADLAAGRLLDPPEPDAAACLALIRRRVPDVITWEDWQRIDAAERARGVAEGRPRAKLTSETELRAALSG